MTVQAACPTSASRWCTHPIARLWVVGAGLVVLTAVGPPLHWRLGGLAHWVVIGLSHGSGFRYVMIAERILGPISGAALHYAFAATVVMLVLAPCVGFRPDRSERTSVGAFS